MFKVILSKTEVKKLMNRCYKTHEPLITVQFHSKTANVIGDFSPVDKQLSEAQRNLLTVEVGSLVEKFEKGIVWLPGYGQYTRLKIELKYAYRFALELAGILHKYADLDAPRGEMIDGLPVAQVLYITANQLHVRCPHCGQVHHHGRESFGIMETHCREIEDGCESYFIKQPE